MNQDNQHSVVSPLDVLTDTRTRWNSTYLPWKRVLELHNAMRFLQEMMKLLEPIERVTRCLCGAEYPTLSFVYPYMELLKKKFAPKDNKSVQTYINLIYGESYEDDDDSVTDDDIPTAGAHQHWQYAHRQFCQKMKNTHVQGQNIRNQVRFSNTELDNLDPNRVEYLPSISTNGLLQKVRAAIYLSMDELWAVLTDIALSTEENRNEAQCLVLILYEELKQSLNALGIEEPSIMDKSYEEDDFFFELESGLQTNPEDSEVACYTRLEPIGIKNDPLE
ncbi:hypothetical protein RirG_114540 [Rhizophagus irregularis DAOM 197198w]|uniref:Uncharacterized protein n=1 Tax=Rhizophagus irregularis (strain DAOM 197198w) TaxID=1432141 RepID=A0A015L4K2_RHIIW|nr:hypothetical protein RirG_114540 [Rhizophagus irregularis DAOM 197198w]